MDELFDPSAIPDSRIAGYSSMTRSPSSKLGLNADSVIHGGLNSLLAAQIEFRGLHCNLP